MKKIWYILFIIIMLFTFNVKASDDCDSKEFARLKELAKKIDFDYDYKLVNDKAVFSVSAYNLNSDLRVLIIEDYYSDKYKEFKDNATHTATLNNFEAGTKVTITIKGFVANWCSGKTILTKTVKLPYYNYYYSEELCKGHEDFKYCKQLIESNISKEQFDKQYQEYLKRTPTPTNIIEDKPETDMTLYFIIGGGVLALILIVLLVRYIIIRRNKNKL